MRSRDSSDRLALPSPWPAAAGEAARGRPSAHAVQARVVRVVDGDTIVAAVEGGRPVRPLHRRRHARRPSSRAPRCSASAQQASAENHRLVDGRTVRLVFDRERRDDYGRLLAYVYTDAGRAEAAVRQRDAGPRRLRAHAHDRAEHRPRRRCLAAARGSAAGRGRGRGLWGALLRRPRRPSALHPASCRLGHQHGRRCHLRRRSAQGLQEFANCRVAASPPRGSRGRTRSTARSALLMRMQ